MEGERSVRARICGVAALFLVATHGRARGLVAISCACCGFFCASALCFPLLCSDTLESFAAAEM